MKHLLAIPHVGTGFGGQRHSTGSVLEALVPFLHDAAIHLDIDIVLVAFEQISFYASQAIRKRLLDKESRPSIDAAFPGFTEAMKRHAIKLAEYARNGKLVLFLGSGVSASAGLPLWGQLLTKLAERVRQSQRHQLDRIKSNPLNQPNQSQ